jgi:hypothetical protein
MEYHFKQHYTLEEARALLPKVRQWLKQLDELREQMQKDEQSVKSIMVAGGDAGGKLVERWVRSLADFRDVIAEFETREIQLKDIQRGLLDFPAIIGDREVFLCWEKDEEDIEHWHDLDAGYAGRERL